MVQADTEPASVEQQRLLDLRDSLVDAMAGVAQDNLRSRAEGSEASAFGMHQADAGSELQLRIGDDGEGIPNGQEQQILAPVEAAAQHVPVPVARTSRKFVEIGQPVRKRRQRGHDN